MGQDLFEKSDLARKTFRQADEILGYPLSRICFGGPEDELKLTSNTQPALLTHSIACWRALTELGVRVEAVAGVNLPMLLKVLNYRSEALNLLADRAAAGGQAGLFHIRFDHCDA